MKCLETRRRPDGTRWRRYRGPDGQIVTTVEVPESVWRQLNRVGRAQDRLAAHQRVIFSIGNLRAVLGVIEPVMLGDGAGEAHQLIGGVGFGQSFGAHGDRLFQRPPAIASSAGPIAAKSRVPGTSRLKCGF